jgi:hypothetical protein
VCAASLSQLGVFFKGKTLTSDLLSSPVCIDLRFLWQSFWLGRVWVLGVFVLETLKLGGLKVPSIFGIKDLL